MQTPYRRRRRIMTQGSIASSCTQGDTAPTRASGGSPEEAESNFQEVDFAELADGSVIESIEDPNDANSSIFARLKNGTIDYVKRLEWGNQILVPVPRNAALVRHVKFPKGADKFGSVRDLLVSIVALLRAFVELEPLEHMLLAYFALSTWLVDRMPVAPYLAFVGPPSSGKTTALRALSLVCRRGLLTSDISSAAFYALCDRVKPTLLIDETASVNNKRELLHLLRTGSTQGLVALRKGQSFNAYGAKVTAWLELPGDTAFNSRCLVISMKISPRANFLHFTDPRMVYEIEKLQKQLLFFRLSHFKLVKQCRMPQEEALQPRTRDLYRALTVAIAEEKELAEEVCGLLQSQESLRDALPVEHAAVLSALWTLVHANPRGGAFKLSGLSRMINDELKQRGERGGLSEKNVGSILTSFHLTNRPRWGSGTVLVLSRRDLEIIHDLFRTYERNSKSEMTANKNCEFCTEHIPEKAASEPQGVSQVNVVKVVNVDQGNATQPTTEGAIACSGEVPSH